MKRSLAPVTLAAALLLVARLPAQAPTDFSGKWTVVPSERPAGTATGATPPTLSAHGDMGSGWGSEITITQDRATLTVSYTYFHPREIQPPVTLKYPLDGTALANTINLGRGPQEQISRASWQGASLVITTAHRFVNPQDGQSMTSETRQVLSLESPAVLAIETTREGVLGGRPSTTRTRYRKS
jgi:hypothetical protein